MLHSHPGAMNYPSEGDRHAFADQLRGTPWLGRLVVPIVTCGTTARDAHEIAVPSGVLSVYIAEPDGENYHVDVQPAVVHVVPVQRDVAALARVVGGEVIGRGRVDMEGVTYLTASVSTDGLELQLLVPSSYPTQAPLILATATASIGAAGRRILNAICPDRPTDAVAAVPLRWDLSVAEADRLVRSFPGEIAAAGQASEVDKARRGIRERLDGVESPTLAARSVLLVGAGSGGSLSLEKLVRSGVEKVIVVDADAVGPENLSRSIYRVADIGLPKVVALRQHLLEINPLVDCQIYQQRLQDMPRELLNKLVSSVDLVVAATDDADAQRTLNHFAYARGVPAVFSGVYAKGHAGEVVFTVPSITKCYRCTTTSRHQDIAESRMTDYGTGRLMSEPALGADIHHVVTASVKIAIGLLQLDDETAISSSRDLVYSALVAGHNYLILSTVAQYGFFKEIFATTPAQHGYQSVWLSTQGDEQCTVCGKDSIDPVKVSGRAPQVSNLLLQQSAASDPKQSLVASHDEILTSTDSEVEKKDD